MWKKSNKQNQRPLISLFHKTSFVHVAVDSTLLQDEYFSKLQHGHKTEIIVKIQKLSACVVNFFGIEIVNEND